MGAATPRGSGAANRMPSFGGTKGGREMRSSPVPFPFRLDSKDTFPWVIREFRLANNKTD